MLAESPLSTRRSTLTEHRFEEGGAMKDPARYSAENASPRELRLASLRLAAWLLALVLLGIGVRALPLGQTTRTGILAWILVGISLYWLYAGLGYRALLLLQVLIFSIATTLLVLKAGLVVLGVEGFDAVRLIARWLILAGGFCAGLNVGLMLVASLVRKRQ
jgi:hypothetical protein